MDDDPNMSKRQDRADDPLITRRTVLVGGLTLAAVAAIGPPAVANDMAWGGYSNGRIPLSALTRLSWTPAYLHPGGAAAFEQVNSAFVARFGKSIVVTDSYRDYDRQVATRAAKGAYAAIPGTSNHGWGKAVDLGSNINQFGTAEHNWMRANAPTYSWVHPWWAHDGISSNGMDEPWHFEYVGGGSPQSAGADPDHRYQEEDDMAFTATGPDGQNWLISGPFRRPITATQRDQLATIAAPATIPYLLGISSAMLVAFADIGGEYRPVTTTS